MSALACRSPMARCGKLHSAWLPIAEVEKVIATDAKVDGQNRCWDGRSGCDSAQAVRDALLPLLTRYDAWISIKAAQVQDLRGSAARPGEPGHADRGERLQGRNGATRRTAGRCWFRLRAGLSMMDDLKVLTAFRIANRATRPRCASGSRRVRRGSRPPIKTADPSVSARVSADQPGRAVTRRIPTARWSSAVLPTGGGETEALTLPGGVCDGAAAARIRPGSRRACRC